MEFISGLFIGSKYSLVVILYYSSQLFVWITIVGCLIWGKGKCLVSSSSETWLRAILMSADRDSDRDSDMITVIN